MVIDIKIGFENLTHQYNMFHLFLPPSNSSKFPPNLSNHSIIIII